MLKIKRNSKPGLVLALIGLVGFVFSTVTVALFENGAKKSIKYTPVQLTKRLTNLSYTNFTFMIIFLLFSIAGIVLCTSKFADKSKRKNYGMLISVLTTVMISIAILLLVIKIASKDF